LSNGENMTNKIFADRLNQGLDEIGLPSNQHERIEAFSKLLNIPRFKAETILTGQMPVDDALLTSIANELEVEMAWLLGRDDD